jgi:hypothetical protein
VPVASPDVDGDGNGLLRRFRVTLDYRRQRMILEPGALVDVPYDYDHRIHDRRERPGVGDCTVVWGSAAEKQGCAKAT